MKKIIFLTNYKNLIPQRNHETEGLMLDVIAKAMEEVGFEVQEMNTNTFIEFLREKQSIQGVYFYYASSQYAIYKSFILDLLVQVKLRGGILIPELRHFIAHENKNFQELEKTRIGLKSPYGIPVGTYEEGVELLNKIAYPVVIKKSTGFRSRNVRRATNIEEGKKILSKFLDMNLRFDTDSFYYLYRRMKYKKHYPKKFGKVILQEYIPNLTHDWKILVLGNLVIGGKRYVRKNDFRASGSKLYEMDEDPPKNVLDFALKCKKQLRCPNVSFDISENKGELHLLEYQTMHFAILGGDPDFYFEFENGKWHKREILYEMDYYIAMGIQKYVLALENGVDINQE